MKTMHFDRKVLTSLATMCGVAVIANSSAARVTVERSDLGATIFIDDQLFAEYRTKSGHQPVIWPLIGPTGKPITRSFPIDPLMEGEKEDHPHHRSLWFAHGIVNGHDFWLEPEKNTPSDQRNLIRHVQFKSLENRGAEAVLVTHNQWLHGDQQVCEDERTFVFGADGENRWIDCSLKIIATDGPVTFGDTKEGTFSVRVAGTMKVESKLGGTIINNRGQRNADAWGMPAEWVDYYGPVDGKTVGIAMFSHPANFRHPCRWHVRTYGLFCANPFGDSQFPQADIKQQPLEIPAGESETLRYRVFVHPGDTQQAKITQHYRNYAADSRAGKMPLLLQEGFEQGRDNWCTTDPDDAEPVWMVQRAPSASRPNHMLRVSGKSKYQPPYRSPHSIALLKDHIVGDFEITAKVQNTNVKAGDHRDLCFFWGYQDPAHFYYVHLGAKPDPHSCQIFIVNDAPRTMITQNKSKGTPWTDGWHQVKIVRDTESGKMEVYFDDMQSPIMTATDKSFTWGRVGVGTFDDHGNFDEFELRGHEVNPPNGSAELP